MSLLCAAAEASAHGGIPRAHSVLVEPNGGDYIVARSNVWGFFVSSDGGASWSWVCAESYGGRSLEFEHRSFAITPGGDIYVANLFDGLQIARGGNLCEFTEHPTFVDEVVQDVVSADASGSRILVLTSTGSADGIVGNVWESTDSGQTFAPVGPALPSDFSGSSLAVAPSDGTRLYVAGKTLGQTADGTVQRSADGGQTWETSTVPVGTENWVARIVGIDPNDPDVVYLRVDTGEGSSGDIQPDQLWLSSDAASTWTQVFAAGGDLPGFTFSPDGAMVLVSGPEDGVWAADSTEILTAGEAAFAQVFTGKVWGLSWTADGLLAGNDDFSPGDEPKFTLGRSLDQGSSFEPVFEICETTLIDCPTDTLTGRTCEMRLTEQGGFDQDYLSGPRCDPGAAGGAAGGSGAGGGGGTTTGSGGSAGTGVDGGGQPDPTLMPGSGESDEAGCSCRTPRSSRSGPLGASAFALTLLGGLLLRRRR